jgi:hypothetical protein
MDTNHCCNCGEVLFGDDVEGMCFDCREAVQKLYEKAAFGLECAAIKYSRPVITGSFMLQRVTLAEAVEKSMGVVR